MMTPIIRAILGSSRPRRAVLNLTNLTVNDVFDPSYAGFKLKRDGTYQGRDSAGYYSVGSSTDWIESSARTSTIGDSYEFKTVKSAGDSLIGVVDDTWADLNADKEGYITTSSLPATYTGTLYVREKAYPANQVSCTLQFDAAIA